MPLTRQVKTRTEVGGAPSVTLPEQVADGAKFVSKGAYCIQSEKNESETSNLQIPKSWNLS